MPLWFRTRGKNLGGIVTLARETIPAATERVTVNANSG
jgi:hypothetical protein